MFESADPVTTIDEVKAILGADFPSQVNKVIDHIDQHCESWINRSPFIVISSANASGAMDISPKGDPAGFVMVLDKHTLAIPDRLGNHRGDTFANVLENPRVGILFVVPKRREVVRVSGSAMIAKDADLLNRMTVKGKRPDLALIVRVDEAFFHCGKAMIRSNMWQPDQWGSIEGLPTYAQALRSHGDLKDTMPNLEQRLAHNESDRLY